MSQRHCVIMPISIPELKKSIISKMANIILWFPGLGSEPGISLFFIYFMSLYHWATVATQNDHRRGWKIGQINFQLMFPSSLLSSIASTYKWNWLWISNFLSHRHCVIMSTNISGQRSNKKQIFLNLYVTVLLWYGLQCLAY
jgi:hypothetical protein